MTDPASFYVSHVLTVADSRKLNAALRRAYGLLRELERKRDSAEIDRVRHGAMHELQTAAGVLGLQLFAETRKEALRQLTQEADEQDLFDTGTGFIDTRPPPCSEPRNCGLAGGSARCGGCSD